MAVDVKNRTSYILITNMSADIVSRRFISKGMVTQVTIDLDSFMGFCDDFRLFRMGSMDLYALAVF